MLEPLLTLDPVPEETEDPPLELKLDPTLADDAELFCEETELEREFTEDETELLMEEIEETEDIEEIEELLLTLELELCEDALLIED